MENLNQNDKVLLLWDQTFDPTSVKAAELKSSKNISINFENIERLSLGNFHSCLSYSTLFDSFAMNFCFVSFFPKFKFQRCHRPRTKRAHN